MNCKWYNEQGGGKSLYGESFPPGIRYRRFENKLHYQHSKRRKKHCRQADTGKIAFCSTSCSYYNGEEYALRANVMPRNICSGRGDSFLGS
ncbi:MAG: hypothetical protein E2O77_10335 [Caldithrix sp.]|nr:MAG: hypothetical protein E2O77_10335 [Caldithrix sp.]